MKKPTYSFSLLMMTILLAWLTLAVTGTANARWLSIHGHSGQIEDESALEKIRRLRWALDCDMKAYSNTWVHFAVPSLKRYNSIRFLRVQYYTDGTAISDLEIYNGAKLEFKMEVPSHWKTKGWHSENVNLSSPISSQNGLCISMKIHPTHHPGDTSRRFKFYSAQADFDESDIITWYVGHNGNKSPGKGTKSNPFHDIQMAIDAAWPGETVKVGAANYYAYYSITMKNGVTVLGEGQDVTIIRGTVTAKNVDSSTKLEGFTIRDGGGMRNENSSPVVTNCTFIDHRGPGMTNTTIASEDSSSTNSSSPIVTNCTFKNNNGGGMINIDSSPVVLYCTFDGNTACSGAGVYNKNSSPTLYRCVFKDNCAGYGYSEGGGGMYNDNSNPWLISCTFDDNSGGFGGGMHNCNGSSPSVTNCIFWRNGSYMGGGIYNDKASPYVTNCTFYDNGSDHGHGNAICNANGSSLTVTNSIFWDPSGPGQPHPYLDQISQDASSSASVNYSNILGGYWVNVQEGYLGGTGNITEKPWFVDPANGDFHLSPYSPCIDKGTNNPHGLWWGEDFEGDPRVFDYNGNGIADMGADEYSPPLVTVYPFGGG